MYFLINNVKERYIMYLKLFNKDYVDRSPVTGISIPSDINYLRRVFHFNMNNIKTYYESRNFSIKNTFILSRIIEHFPPMFAYDSYRYVEYIRDKAKYLGKHFQFTNEIEDGVIHPGYFFGKDNEEIIFSLDEYFNPNEAERNWKTISCITIYKHNRNDLKLLLPLSKDDGSRNGLCVIGVNLPLLALKYRAFIREQMSNSEGISLNKNHFIMKYVLNLTCDGIVDHVMLNKLMDLFYNREEVTPKFKHPFKLFFPDVQVNRYLSNTLDVITNKNIDFINIMHNIQLINCIDASELLILPDMPLTRQVLWSMVISRLDYMIFLYDVSKSKNINRHFINDWKVLIKRLIRDNVIEGRFSYETEKDIKEKMYIISSY
ncbi:MAG: hypothetical protein ACD_33C00045G0030 [uncultured bacterium]|nr:MAG: hypothetical protein ACD_33C00045G0030 [uncultured bacterium]